MRELVIGGWEGWKGWTGRDEKRMGGFGRDEMVEREGLKGREENGCWGKRERTTSGEVGESGGSSGRDEVWKGREENEEVGR